MGRGSEASGAERGAGRWIDARDNPFSERDKRNADQRRALLNQGRAKLDEMEKHLRARAEQNRRFKP